MCVIKGISVCVCVCTQEGGHVPLKIGKGEGLRELNFSKLRESPKRKGGGMCKVKDLERKGEKDKHKLGASFS